MPKTERPLVYWVKFHEVAYLHAGPQVKQHAFLISEHEWFPVDAAMLVDLVTRNLVDVRSIETWED